MKPVGFDYVSSPSKFARSNYYYALIGGLSVTGERFFFERQYYPAYEILLITAGKGWFRQGREWHGLIAGDCLLHDMRYPHAYKADPEHPFQMLYLVFDGYQLDRLWADYYSASHTLLHLDADVAASFADKINAILNLMQTQQASDEAERQISVYLYETLLFSLHQLQRGARLDNQSKPETMIVAQHYLNEQYLSIVSMEDAADHVNLSYYHFIRQFKRYFGCTPKEYVQLKRINHAKHQLLMTNKSVTEIGGLSGFNSYNTFLHAFRQIEHCSPQEFRENWKMF